MWAYFSIRGGADIPSGFLRCDPDQIESFTQERLGNLNPNDVYSFEENGIFFCYDLDSLQEWAFSEGTNPLTRQPLPEQVLDEIQILQNDKHTIRAREYPEEGRFLQDIYENIQQTVKKGCNVPPFEDILRDFQNDLTNNVKDIILWDSPKRQNRNYGPELNFQKVVSFDVNQEPEYEKLSRSTLQDGEQFVGTVHYQLYFTEPTKADDDEFTLERIAEALSANPNDKVLNNPCGRFLADYDHMDNSLHTIDEQERFDYS